jgi:hypothetical protein
MMSLQPSNNSYFQPKVVPLNAIARKATVEDPTETNTDVEADFDDELAELEKEDKLQAAIKAKRDAKKAAENAKKQAEAKKSRQALFKKIGMGVGITAGGVATVGLGLAGYWYFHSPKPPVTTEGLVKLMENLDTMKPKDKDDLYQQFKAFELGYKPTEKGFFNNIKTWWHTKIEQPALMAPENKNKAIGYIFKGGAIDYIFNRNKFDKVMLHLRGDIFDKKANQKILGLKAAINNSAVILAKVNDSKIAEGLKDENGNYLFTVLSKDADLKLTRDIKFIKTDGLDKLAAQGAAKDVEKTASIASQNIENVHIEEFLPSLKRSITGTLNPYLKSKGLAEIDVENFSYKVAGAGAVAATFKIEHNGQSYIAKMVHPSINAETFPYMFQQQIHRYQLEGFSYKDAVKLALETVGTVAQEINLSKEMKAHQVHYDNYLKGYSTLKIPAPLAIHNQKNTEGSIDMTMFQEEAEDFIMMADMDKLLARHTIDEIQAAHIHILTDDICEMFLGKIHGDLHPGNLGLNSRGEVCKIDFGRVLHLKGDVPKNMRALGITLLDPESSQAERIMALKAVNQEAYNDLSTKQQDTLIASLEREPFRMVDKLFQAGFFQQADTIAEADRHIGINMPSIKGQSQLRVAHRTDAGLARHTIYDKTYTYKSDGNYDDKPTELMPIYEKDIDTIIKTLFQDGTPPDAEQKARIKQSLLNEISLFTKSQNLIPSSIKYMQQQGHPIDFGFKGLNIPGIPIGDWIQNFMEKSYDAKDSAPEFMDELYYRPLTPDKVGFKRSA